MGGETCHQKGRERGRWYEIKCIKEVIINKEARGEDATFERGLLRAWGVETPPRTTTKSKIKGIKPSTGRLPLRSSI